MLKFEATSKKNYSINRPLYTVCILKFNSYSGNGTITTHLRVDNTKSIALKLSHLTFLTFYPQ